MAKPALTLRSEKGSALTFNEMDTNLGNLANAVVQVSAGGTTSNIDLNSGFTIANSATVTATLVGTTVTLTGSSANLENITTNVNVGGNYLSDAILYNVRERVHTLGNIGSTLSIDANLGSIQTATVTQNFNFNTTNLSNFDAGETVSVVLKQGVNANSRIMTSNIAFAAGSKTLSTANAAIDTVHITYTGTEYLAVLVKGYV